MELELAGGYWVELDELDCWWLRVYNWRVVRSGVGGGVLVCRGVRYGGVLRQVYMHRIVGGLGREYLVRYRDGNSLNLCRGNLVLVERYGGGDVGIFGIGGGRSKYVGVTWDVVKGLWRSELGGMLVGYYDNEYGAIVAWNDKVMELGLVGMRQEVIWNG